MIATPYGLGPRRGYPLLLFAYSLNVIPPSHMQAQVLFPGCLCNTAKFTRGDSAFILNHMEALPLAISHAILNMAGLIISQQFVPYFNHKCEIAIRYSFKAMALKI